MYKAERAAKSTRLVLEHFDLSDDTMNETERPSSTLTSAEKKARAFAEAREMADAQSRQLAPTLGRHLIVVALGFLVIAFWVASSFLHSCSVQSHPSTPSTDSTATQK